MLRVSTPQPFRIGPSSSFGSGVVVAQRPAFAAGAVNAIAGGGTLLTFPSLLAVISPVFANATSTTALLPGSLASAWGYRQELARSRRHLTRLWPPSLVGGIIGSLLLTRMPERIFAGAVPWLLVPLLGPRYAGTEPLLSTMAALVLVQGIEIVCGRLLLAANLNVVRAAWVTLAGIACVAATLAAVPIFGVPGAIVCAVAAYLLLDVLYAYSLVGVLRARATAPNSAEVGGVGP